MRKKKKEREREAREKWERLLSFKSLVKDFWLKRIWMFIQANTNNESKGKGEKSRRGGGQEKGLQTLYLNYSLFLSLYFHSLFLSLESLFRKQSTTWRGTHLLFYVPHGQVGCEQNIESLSLSCFSGFLSFLSQFSFKAFLFPKIWTSKVWKLWKGNTKGVGILTPGSLFLVTSPSFPQSPLFPFLPSKSTPSNNSFIPSLSLSLQKTEPFSQQAYFASFYAVNRVHLCRQLLMAYPSLSPSFSPSSLPSFLSLSLSFFVRVSLLEFLTQESWTSIESNTKKKSLDFETFWVKTPQQPIFSESFFFLERL